MTPILLLGHSCLQINLRCLNRPECLRLRDPAPFYRVSICVCFMGYFNRNFIFALYDLTGFYLLSNSTADFVASPSFEQSSLNPYIQHGSYHPSLLPYISYEGVYPKSHSLSIWNVALLARSLPTVSIMAQCPAFMAHVYLAKFLHVLISLPKVASLDIRTTSTVVSVIFWLSIATM